MRVPERINMIKAETILLLALGDQWESIFFWSIPPPPGVDGMKLATWPADPVVWQYISNFSPVQKFIRLAQENR